MTTTSASIASSSESQPPGASSREVKLLVSVRDASEAASALAGGADIIDVKEPARGPLGMADAVTLHAIARVVNGRAPLSIALGELTDLMALDSDTSFAALRDLPATTAYVKAGLAKMAHHDWRHELDALSQQLPATISLVPVAYWDGQLVDSPSPMDVLAWASQRGMRHLLIDTACKDQPGLLERPGDAAALARLIKDARQANIHIALAGRLMGDRLAQALALRPTIIGVRSAVCEHHQRQGKVCSEAVRHIKAMTTSHAKA